VKVARSGRLAAGKFDCAGCDLDRQSHRRNKTEFVESELLCRWLSFCWRRRSAVAVLPRRFAQACSLKRAGCLIAAFSLAGFPLLRGRFVGVGLFPAALPRDLSCFLVRVLVWCLQAFALRVLALALPPWARHCRLASLRFWAPVRRATSAVFGSPTGTCPFGLSFETVAMDSSDFFPLP